MSAANHLHTHDLLLSMFKYVDSNDWAGLKNFYTTDCQYERPGFPIIQGLQSLLDFYANVRPISKGIHTIDCVVVEDSLAIASGSFKGTLRVGTALELQFMDRYVFQGDKIQRRKTFFYTPLA